MSDPFSIRDFIANNSDNSAELRARWASEAKLSETKVNTPMQSTQQSYLDSLVSEQVETLQQAKRDAAIIEANRVEQETFSKNKALKQAFKSLIERGVGAASNGAFHFSYDGVAYTVTQQDGWILNGGAFKDYKLSGAADATINLVNALASKKVSSR